MSVLLEAEHLTKIFTQRGKEPFQAVADVSFTLASGRDTGNRRRVRLWEKYAGKNAYTFDGYQQKEPLKFEGKDITKTETKSQLKDLYMGNIQMVFQNPVGSFDPRRTLE